MIPLVHQKAFSVALLGNATGCSRRWGIMSADLMGFGALSVISLLVGLLLNQVRHQPLPLVYRSQQERLHAAVVRLAPETFRAPLPDTVTPPRDIGLNEFQALVAAGKGIVIDARSPFFYRQGHVPGALNISREDFDADYRRLGSRLTNRKTDLISVYCSGADCQDSTLVADALRTLGYSRLLVYREGWEEWSQSGLPQEK